MKEKNTRNGKNKNNIVIPGRKGYDDNEVIFVFDVKDKNLKGA